MNKIILYGRTTKDITVRYTTNGDPVATTSLAVKSLKGDTDFFNITAFNKTAKILADYVKKGNRLLVSGSLKIKSYENSKGYKVLDPVIYINQVTLIESRNETNNAQNPDDNNGIDFSDLELDLNEF